MRIFNLSFIIKLRPIYIKIKNYIIFQIELNKKLINGKTCFVEKLGYYNTDQKKKIISIKGQRLGYWLNRGAVLNPSVYKILRKFLAKEK